MSKFTMVAVLAVAIAGMLPVAAARAAGPDEAAVRAANHEFYQALNAMFTGDIAPMEQVWSHADDVTYMGPDGKFLVGWSDVSANWTKQAGLKLGGEIREENVQMKVGTDLATVLIDVLEPAQKEIGRRWQEGEISVAQEHLCTSVTQQVMSELYPYLFTGVPRRHRLVAAQAPGSLHEVGLRMVVDLLEHEGWETTYLGEGNTPDEVVEALVTRHADVLAISASMPGQVRGVVALVTAVRSDPRTAAVKVVVGGRPFLVDPGLVAEVGADGSAADARETVELCARIVESDDVAV